VGYLLSSVVVVVVMMNGYDRTFVQRSYGYLQ
jgi:hypothetical protein